LSSNLVLSTLLMVPAGFAIMVQLSGTNTLLQTIVPDEMRGRVMSFYSVSLIGMSTFGSLISGKLASYIGAPKTVWIGGAICLGGALIFRLRFPSIRKAMNPALTSRGTSNDDAGQSSALGPAVDYF
jgi:MFS family permease